MTNADKFKQIFGIYATELWAKPEKEFLEWLNYETDGERKKGYWEYKMYDEKTGIDNHYFCSVCGYPQGQIAVNFCACCGADMRGETDG